MTYSHIICNIQSLQSLSVVLMISGDRYKEKVLTCKPMYVNLYLMQTIYCFTPRMLCQAFLRTSFQPYGFYLNISQMPTAWVLRTNDVLNISGRYYVISHHRKVFGFKHSVVLASNINLRCPELFSSPRKGAAHHRRLETTMLAASGELNGILDASQTPNVQTSFSSPCCLEHPI